MNTFDQIFTYTDTVALAVEEEADLISRAQQGDTDAQMTLVTAYGPALRSAVARFRKGMVEGATDLDVEDLQSAALVALLDLIQTHDPEVSPRLAGRVAQHLAAALGEEFSSASAFAVPSRTLKRFFGILKEADGDLAAAEALAPERQMRASTFREIAALVRSESVEGISSDDEGAPVDFFAEPVFAPTPVVDVEDKILVEAAFAAVDDEQERICRLSYGFTEYEPVPDAEIAHRMGLTRPTVQRKRGKALGAMRKALGVTHV